MSFDGSIQKILSKKPQHYRAWGGGV